MYDRFWLIAIVNEKQLRGSIPHCFQIGLHFHLLAQWKRANSWQSQTETTSFRSSLSKKDGTKESVCQKELNKLGSTRRPNGGKENRTKLTFKTREIKVQASNLFVDSYFPFSLQFHSAQIKPECIKQNSFLIFRLGRRLWQVDWQIRDCLLY